MELTSIQKEILLTILHNSSSDSSNDVSGESNDTSANGDDNGKNRVNSNDICGYIKRTMKAKDIAKILDRHTGTIRNQMQTLLALKLVKSIPGPNGGYIPTKAAYEQFGIDPLSKRMVIQVRTDEGFITKAPVTEITLTTVNDLRQCKCQIKVIGDLRAFSMGDIIRVGPISVNNTMVYGEIYGKDEVINTLLCSILEITIVPTNPLKEYMSGHDIMIFDEVHV
ncbi:MAG: hypothetical protein KAH86_03345 [Methanosarcinales archaeon]|nr:hypothetical protein [Methanosarcinales archaeon]